MGLIARETKEGLEIDWMTSGQGFNNLATLNPPEQCFLESCHVSEHTKVLGR